MPAYDQTGLASAILAELPHLRAYARLMTNDRSEAEREVEATLESASADDIGWRDKARLRVSLFKILRGFLARDRRSMLKRDIPHSYSSPFPAGTANGDAQTDGDAQTVREVGPTLLRLDFGDREAIILSAAARFSDPEIAEICGCAPETIRGRVHRGRAQLAKILRVEFADDLNPVTVPPAAVEAGDAAIMTAAG
jgi:RNA polymerase sigma-70 factor (ECF subfamily)